MVSPVLLLLLSVSFKASLFELPLLSYLGPTSQLKPAWQPPPHHPPTLLLQDADKEEKHGVNCTVNYSQFAREPIQDTKGASIHFSPNSSLRLPQFIPNVLDSPSSPPKREGRRAAAKLCSVTKGGGVAGKSCTLRVLLQSFSGKSTALPSLQNSRWITDASRRGGISISFLPLQKPRKGLGEGPSKAVVPGSRGEGRGEDNGGPMTESEGSCPR